MPTFSTKENLKYLKVLDLKSKFGILARETL